MDNCAIALRILVLWAGITTLSSCSPVKGYPGPELPESQISALYLSYDSTSIEVTGAGMEGLSFGGSGIHVLPGPHVFEMAVKIKEPPRSCHAYPEMDRDGYRKCLKKKGSEKCDCYDYQTIHETCTREVRRGRCHGRLSTSAGTAYDIGVHKRRSEAEVRITQKSPYREIGQGSCEMGDWDTETDTSYVGTGRSSAREHGIYRCYE